MVQHENLRSGFTRSVLLHVSLLAAIGLYNWWTDAGDPFGDKNAGAAAIGVTAVANIPLPTRGPENPVANDSPSVIPQAEPEKPAPKEAPEPEPEDAISLLPKETKSKQPLAPLKRLDSFKDLAPNQLTAKSPQAVSNPMYAMTGAGQTGLSGENSMGTRFEEYASRVMEITRRAWRVQDVDRAVKSAPAVVVRFDLLRSGKVQNLRLVRASGIPTLDLSIRNAIEDSTYPPLPEAYERDSATMEFTFELKR